MAEQAWYRKYRPRTLDDYMGEGVKTSLLARMANDSDKPQVVMFHGTRGCGKTSAARLMAKEYLCLSPVDGHACGECESCKEIDDTLINAEAGLTCSGVEEIDATIESGKADITRLVEEALVPPIGMQYKVIILDECHMLTASAQNSLLKVLEDIPKHLVVIFCTTDIDKVLGTVKSRCQMTITVKKPTVEMLADRLNYICKQEGVTTSMEALRIIANKSDRIPRDAINKLEDIAKTYDKNVTVDSVRKSVGNIETELYMDFVRSSNRGLPYLLEFIRKVKERDISEQEFALDFSKFCIDCLNIRHGISAQEFPEEHVAKVVEMFKSYSTAEFDVLLQILEKCLVGMGGDDRKNQLMLINMGMRISKIKLLAENGLKNELKSAEEENKASMGKYAGKLRQEREERNDKMAEMDETKVDTRTMAESFSGFAKLTGMKAASLGLGENISLVPNEGTQVLENNGRMTSQGLEDLLGRV